MIDYRLGTLFVLLLFCLNTQALPLVRQPDRAFGYVIGDVLEQGILLEADVDLVGIPPERRVDEWLERVSSTVVTKKKNQRWLMMQYQVTNSPLIARSISLPALEINTSNGQDLQVSAWFFSLSPLAPVNSADAASQPLLQPDRTPQLSNMATQVRRLIYSLVALGTVLVAWVGWWFLRQRADTKRLPFAHAWSEIRKMGHKQLDTKPEAWFALHHAFNGCAGRTINSSTVDELIRQKPWLHSLQSNIDDFYALSSARFFAEQTALSPYGLYEFARTLYRVEKKHSDVARIVDMQ